MSKLAALAALLLAAPLAQAAEPVRLASDAWCPFVCASGERVTGGYLVDAASAALSAQGRQAIAVLMPLNRAVRETERGHIEGVYAPAIDVPLKLSQPLAYSRACFFTLHDSAWRYSGLASLAGQQVGIIDDYGYDDGPMDDYISRNRREPGKLKLAFGQTAGLSNLRMLLHGRVPVVLEHEAVMAQLAAGEQASRRLRRAGCLERRLPLTVGFAADNPKATASLAALEAGLRQLEASGALHALRRRYQLQDD
ncbi:transporter substrate-binding domain-containing protein [Pseudoduganella violaceinigra]|uniref:transporter substrate-binding domain-containing protein n=1 Tax=Pseudoduganella violaceinigra TaxID=246602 RepID=UPI000409E79B|nr:transporter substrate-binding domain-containing protein [Pseudoduganella violaceinigra]